MDKALKIEEIKRFLDKSYEVKEGKFFVIHKPYHIWGVEIYDFILDAFSFGSDITITAFKEWSYKNGIDVDSWEEAWAARKLKTQWSPELAQDLALYGVRNVEEQLINLLTEEISKEIDNEILRQLKSQIKTSEEFLSLVKCVGYEKSPTIYDQITFRPTNYLVAVKHHEMINERQNNNIWQNYFRPTRVDDQA